MSATTKRVGHGIGHQHGHRACLLCGDKNPWSLGLAFEPDGEGGVRTTFEPHERLQGYDGMLHGGVAAALLDAAMTHCLFHRGVRAVTADLRVRYPHPVPMGIRVGLRAWVTETCEPLYRLKAELTDRDHRVLVWVQATFCEVSADGTSLSKRTTDTSCCPEKLREKIVSKLPDVVGKAWEDRDGPVILATVDENRIPNSIYVTCVGTHGEERLVIADNYFNKTRHNVRLGGQGALLFRDKTGKAYQIKGTLEYHTEGDVYDSMKKWNPPKHPGHAALAIRVEEVFSGAERLL